MGGNVQFGDHVADRIDLKKIDRDLFVASARAFFIDLDCIFNYWHEKPLINPEQYLSGSSVFLMDSQNYPTSELLKFKPSFGDIDIQVNVENEKDISDFLTRLKGAWTIVGWELIDFKKSIGSFIALFHVERFGINVQVDFELVEFVNGRPSEWETFAHSSSWHDVKAGVKGVGHKFLLRALNAPSLKQVMVQTASNKVKKILSSEYAFSLKGLRRKLEPIRDQNQRNAQIITDRGIPLFREIPSKQGVYVRDFKEIFEHFFWENPAPEDVKCLWSFIGILDLVKESYTVRQMQAIMDGFVNTLWGPDAQKLYRDAPMQDIYEKNAMVNIMVAAFELTWNPDWYVLREKFYA